MKPKWHARHGSSHITDDWNQPGRRGVQNFSRLSNPSPQEGQEEDKLTACAYCPKEQRRRWRPGKDGSSSNHDCDRDTGESAGRAVISKFRDYTARIAYCFDAVQGGEDDEEHYADRDQPLANTAWSGEHLTCLAPGQPETADAHNRAKSDRWGICGGSLARSCQCFHENSQFHLGWIRVTPLLN